MPPQKVSQSTATEHASSSKSTATEHAGSTSGAKDPRLENIFQEACANAPPKIRCLLQEVSALGHYPKRYKQPQNKEERDSNTLAKKLTQARSSLNPAAEKYLEAMQAASTATEHAQQAEGLMQQLRAADPTTTWTTLSRKCWRITRRAGPRKRSKTSQHQG